MIKANNTINPLVSILVPVYNRKEMSEEAILSALEQDYPAIEVVVGDNCSTDGTFEYLKARFEGNPKVILFQNSKNLGPVGNWKECLKRSSGKYVKILWSDDLMDPSFVHKSVKVMEANPTISFVYSSVVIFEKKTELTQSYINQSIKRYRLGKTGVRPGRVFGKNSIMRSYSMPVSPGCAIFRKDKVLIQTQIDNHISYNHEKTGAGTDLFIFLNSLGNGENFYFFDEPLIFFREHEQSISCSDRNVMLGYWSAKINYLKTVKSNRIMEQYLNSDIASNKFHYNFFKTNEIKPYLQQFYGNDPVHYSAFNAIGWGILREIWILRNYLSIGDKHVLFGSWRKRFLGK